VDRHDHRIGNDDYTQAGNLFRLMTPDARERLIGNMVASMKSVPPHVQELQIQHFYEADPAYGIGVAKGLGVNIEKIAARAKQVIFRVPNSVEAQTWATVDVGHSAKEPIPWAPGKC
jgi:hypothetical protein